MSEPLVLVADDDDDILLLVTTRLRRDGFEVVAARDGDGALALVRAQRPHVAVLDIGMPGLDGLEVLAQIRADEGLRDTRVLLLTAKAQESDVRRGYTAGADAYVRKPVLAGRAVLARARPRRRDDTDGTVKRLVDVSREFRAGALFLAAGVVLTGVYFALPAGGAAALAVYESLGAAASLAILVGVRRFRPEHRLPWLLLSAGNALFVIGDVLSDLNVGASSVPSPSDGFYLAGYPFLTAALVLLVLSAGGRDRTAAFADVGIVTCAFALFQWVFVMAPAIRAGSGISGQVVAGLYPAMDVVLLAGFAGFFVSPAWRTPSFGLLSASVAVFFIGDEIFGLSPGTYRTGDWLDATWMLSYVLFGAAALHPSMRALSLPRRMATLRVSRVRIGLLAAALLSAPVVLLVQHERGGRLEIPAVFACAAAVAVLVVGRLTGILRALERIRLRERAARTLAEEAQMQLSQQNERLVEADRVKDEFVALISHDLRTPLTSIIGYVELALDEDVDPPLDEERRSYLDVVSRSSERLLRLVDDLLFVARLQAGRLVLEPSSSTLPRSQSRRSRRRGRTPSARVSHSRSRRRPGAGGGATVAGFSSCWTISSRTRSSSRRKAAGSTCAR